MTRQSNQPKYERVKGEETNGELKQRIQWKQEKINTELIKEGIEKGDINKDELRNIQIR